MGQSCLSFLFPLASHKLTDLIMSFVMCWLIFGDKQDFPQKKTGFLLLNLQKSNTRLSAVCLHYLQLQILSEEIHNSLHQVCVALSPTFVAWLGKKCLFHLISRRTLSLPPSKGSCLHARLFLDVIFRE